MGEEKRVRRTVAINEAYCRGDILVPISSVEGGFRAVKCQHYDLFEVSLGAPTLELLAAQVLEYEEKGWTCEGGVTVDTTTHMEQFLIFFKREGKVDRQYAQIMLRQCQATYCPYPYEQDIRTIALFGTNDLNAEWEEIEGTRKQIDMLSPEEWSIAILAGSCANYTYIQLKGVEA